MRMNTSICYVTVKQATQRPVPLSRLVMFTVLAPDVVPEEIVMLAVSLPELTNVVEFTVIPDPKRTVAPARKFEPKMSTERVAPLAPWLGEVDVTTGAGRIVRHPRHMAVPPPEVTVTSRAPTGAVAVAFTLMDSLVLLTKAVETTVAPVPDTVVVAPDWKLVPFTERVRVPFWPSVFGLTDEMAGPPAPIVTMPLPVLVWPSGFVTVTLWGPEAAPTVETFNVTCVGLLKVTLLTVTPPVADAPMWLNGTAFPPRFDPGS